MIITHDFHVHTNLSLCARPEATLELYIDKCKVLGLKKMAITNHMWDHAVGDWGEGEFYSVQDYAYINTLRASVEEANRKGATFLFGCEAEYSYRHRRPAISPAVAEQMQVLLVPHSHTHLIMPKSFYEPHRKHIEFMIDAFMDIINSDVAQYITSIPHPFLAVGCPYDNQLLLNEITDDEFKRCFSASAKKGIALEINPHFINGKTLEEIYRDPILRMYNIGKQCGCKFTVGSDAHGKSDFDCFEKIYILCSLLDLTEEDFHPLTR